MSTAPVAPSSSQRFWIVVACFAILNVVAWFTWNHWYIAHHRGHLHVESFAPGNDAVVDRQATLRWRFDADVIPTDVYAKPPGTMTPTVAGRWQWESPRTLDFVPAAGLPRAVPVAFTLSPDVLLTPTGGRLNQPYTTRLRPEPLAVRSVRQSATLDDTYIIELAFNDRVVPGDVLAHLVVTGPNGQSVRCRLFGQAAGDKVRVQTDPLPATLDGGSLDVRLTPGLVGAAGPLGLVDAYETNIGLARALSATDLTASAPTRGQPFLTVNFNDAINAVDLKRVLSVDPPVAYTLTSGEQSVRLTGAFGNGERYTVRFADPPSTVTVADRRHFPKPGSLSAFVPDAGRDCWIDNDQGYLSTAGNRTVTAHVINVDQVRVTVTRVYDDNLVAWRNAVGRGYDGNGGGTEPYARPAAERVIPCAGRKNQRRDVQVRLDDLLPATLARSGVWRITVAPAKGEVDDSGDGSEERWYYNNRTSAVVTLSDIGLTSKQTLTGLVAWATSLRSSAPLAGVRVRAYSDKNQLLGSATTGPDGLARIDHVNPAPGESVAVLLADVPAPLDGATTMPTTAPAGQPATCGELTWLDVRQTEWDLSGIDTSGRSYLRAGHAAFVYAERGIYRPGETVHLRAIVRRPGDVAPKQTFPVTWRFRRPDLHNWKTVPAMLNGDGTVAADVPLPADLTTGQWTADLSLPGENAPAFGSATFQVEEFIPNRLKVAVRVANGDKRCAVDDAVPVEVQGDYLFGRPAAGLSTEVKAHAAPVPFAPAGWDGWTFGDAADVSSADDPGRIDARHARRRPKSSGDAATAGDTTATLDNAGHFRGTIRVNEVVHADDKASARYHGPWRLTVDASVSEAGGRAVTAGRQVDVDGVPAYVAVRRAGPSTTPGQPCPFELRLVRPDGTADTEEADLSVRLLHESWNCEMVSRNGRYQYDCTRVLNPVASTDLHVANGAASWSPTVPTPGEFVLVATVADTGATTTTAFYASDGGGWDETVDRTHPDRLDVRVLGPGEPDVPGTDSRTRPAAPPQRVGSTARVLVAAPFAGRLLLTVETDEVVQTQVIDMPASHVVVPVDVTDACRPGAFVTATVLRPIEPNAAWKPHRAFGVARLNVDPADGKLTVALSAPDLLRPMTSLDVDLAVTNPDGKPAADAAVAVAAVDEGICSLTNFATPDPLAFFTAKRGLGVRSADVFDLLMPEVAHPEVGGDDSGDGKAQVDMGRHGSPIGGHRVRPVALPWVTVHTDEAGHARASFPVPPFQGRLRIMAVASSSNRVGSAERGVTVRSPLLAQTSWPRFAAPGDRFVVPIVLFNNRPIAGDANVSVEPDGEDKLLTFDGKLAPVALSPNGQGQTAITVRVGNAAGVARVRLTATMEGESYTEALELPVRPAAPFSEFGGIARASVGTPTMLTGLVPMLPGTATLGVDVTPWPTLNLPKGLEYLDRYPYGCVEQTTSTLFPLVALGEIGRHVDPARFDPAQVREKVDVGVTRLMAMQTADGGLSMWIGQTDPWPWASVYAAHFLTVARADGYAVPDDFYDHLMGYVRHQLDTGKGGAGELEVQAYAAYVLALAGKPERTVMNRLTELATTGAAPADGEDDVAMRGDAQLFLSSAWLLAGRRDLAEDMLPAAMPAVRTTRQHGGNLGSPVRDRAIQALTLEQVDPDRADLPDLVQQIADAGMADRWASTQDVAYASLAVGQYLQLQSAKHPAAYDTATLMLGQRVLAATEHGAPLAWSGAMPEGDTPAVQLYGPAGAVAHVGWLQSGVPLTPPPAKSNGITLRRHYRRLDGTEIGGTVRSGDLVRVEIDIAAPGDLPNVVLDDLLPAGLEVENGRLATAAHDRAAEAATGGPPTFGDGMVDVRDDRVILVGTIPGGGHCRATYLARAVTPGSFVAPPARAEAMYDLNVNGTSASGRLVVTGGGASSLAAVGE